MVRPRRPLSGRGRLARGFLLIAVLTLTFATAGHYLGVVPHLDPSGLWRFLGVRVGSGGGGSSTGGDGLAPGAGSGGREDVPPGDGAGSGSGSLAVPSEDIRVLPGATFVWTVVYECCGHEESVVTTAGAGIVGLTRDQLVTELKDWTVTAFAPERAELERPERDAMCPAHSRCTLRLEGDDLMLYAGSLDDVPSVRLILIGPTGIKRGDLSQAEVDIFEAGKAFKDREDVLRYIEGLSD